jgi:hypothetical protein
MLPIKVRMILTAVRANTLHWKTKNGREDWARAAANETPMGV